MKTNQRNGRIEKTWLNKRGEKLKRNVFAGENRRNLVSMAIVVNLVQYSRCFCFFSELSEM